jgi:hypothetical protein
MIMHLGIPKLSNKSIVRDDAARDRTSTLSIDADDELAVILHA